MIYLKVKIQKSDFNRQLSSNQHRRGSFDQHQKIECPCFHGEKVGKEEDETRNYPFAMVSMSFAFI